MSLWKVRILLFVPASQVTSENKALFGSVFANNGSGETVEDESRLFDAAIRLSSTGELPAQAFGINSSLLFPDMRTAMLAFLQSLNNVRYYVIANVALPQYEESEFIDSNKEDFTWSGVFTWQDALNDLYLDYGLQVIQES